MKSVTVELGEFFSLDIGNNRYRIPISDCDVFLTSSDITFTKLMDRDTTKGTRYYHKLTISLITGTKTMISYEIDYDDEYTFGGKPTPVDPMDLFRPVERITSEG